MGGRSWRKNLPADDYTSQPHSQHCNDFISQPGNRRRANIDTHEVTDQACNFASSNNNGFQRFRERRPLPPSRQSHGFFPPNNWQSRNEFAGQFAEKSFLLKSKHFKQRQLETVAQILRDILDWFPDDDESDGAMDWQPECEIVIPQSLNNIRYCWDTDYRKNNPVGENFGKNLGLISRTTDPVQISGILRRRASDGVLGYPQGEQCSARCEGNRNFHDLGYEPNDGPWLVSGHSPDHVSPGIEIT